jgi:hypothetical protein
MGLSESEAAVHGHFASYFETNDRHIRLLFIQNIFFTQETFILHVVFNSTFSIIDMRFYNIISLYLIKNKASLAANQNSQSTDFG